MVKRLSARSAFSMIELIFAIVIIGITVVSLPMVNQVISKSTESNLVQEAIFASSAQINQVLSYRWDENSTKSDETLSKVVWTSSSDCNNSTKLRDGHINEPLHRRCLDDNATRPTTTLGIESSDSGTADDIDDMIQTTTTTIFTNSPGSATGYKQDYKMRVDVAYADFGTITAADKNMKRVTVTISDGNSTITVLRAFSANIGEIDYYKRSYY